MVTKTDRRRYNEKKLFIVVMICLTLINTKLAPCYADEVALSLSDFAFVRDGMYIQDIVDVVGEPDYYWGSGIRRGMYNLSDGSVLGVLGISDGLYWKKELFNFMYIIMKDGSVAAVGKGTNGNVLITDHENTSVKDDIEGLKLSDINFVRINMEKQEIRNVLGEPTCDTKLKDWWDIYRLNDGNKIYLNYLGTNTLKSVMIELSDGVRFHVKVYNDKYKFVMN